MKQFITACASILILLSPLTASAFDESVKRPILYPNAHFEIMGREAALADIEDCWMMARETGASENSEAQVSQDAANDLDGCRHDGAGQSAPSVQRDCRTLPFRKRV
ncbi:MAG: hypothetical protein HGJ93_01820 [Desulfosarcina sp.]|nr:hypothetical protein [Desulfosarcina sp.]MBC2764716.1 hypothetical protein [Desulfosarcina sp.]